MGTQPPRRQINKSTVHTVLQRLHTDPILQPALLHRRIALLTSLERSRNTVRTNVTPPQSYGMYVAGNAETQAEYWSLRGLRRTSQDIAGAAEGQPGFLSTTSRWQILGTQSRDDKGVLYSGGECLQSSILRTPSRILARVVAHVIDLLCARIWI